MPLLHKDYNGLPIGLPEHLLYKILDDVTPEQAVAAFSVGHHTRKFIGNNAFWERKFKRHFPHCYAEFAKNKNLGWYAAFRQTYGSEYAGLPVESRLLFSLVKEADVRSLRAKRITLKIIDLRDRFSRSLLTWAQRTGSQSLLNYIYELALASYMTEDQSSVDVLKVDAGHRSILYWAIVCNQPLDSIASLLSQGSRLLAERYNENIRPIHVAVEMDRLDIVQLFLEKEPGLLDVVDNTFGTPLFWASMQGRIKIARHLLNVGANVTIIAGYLQSSAIHIAAQNGHLDVVRALLEKSDQLLERSDYLGRTPLLLAALYGRTNVVACLIGQGANLNASTNLPGSSDHGKTPLYWAAERGHSAVVRELILAGADVTTALGPKQSQPIHVAVERGHLEVVRALIESHPSLLEQRNGQRLTPLLLALIDGCSVTAAYLISQGADVNASYAVPFDAATLYVAIHHECVEIVRQLVSAGVALTTVVSDDAPGQPVHCAVLKGNSALVQALTENKPELLELRDYGGATPLLLAVRQALLTLRQGYISVIELLINQGANLNALTLNGQTALEEVILESSASNRNDVLRVLVNALADPVTNKGGEQLPALHAAVRDGKLDVARTFIDIRPDLVNQKDADGKTPLDWAVARGYATIAVMLLEQGAKFGLTKGLTKVIQKTGFSKVIRDKLKLAAYMSKRATQPEYKKSFRLFGHTFNFGFSKTKKLEAAAALREVVFNGADRASLAQHKKVLNNGDLGAIYRRFRVR